MASPQRKTRASLLVCVCLLTGCGLRIGPQPVYPRWHHVVPDNYTGYVAMHYECASGPLLLPQHNVYTIVYDDMGVFCTASSQMGMLTELPTAQTRSGVPLAYSTKPISHGVGVCCATSRSIGVGVLANRGSMFELDVAWVGDQQQYETLDDDDYKRFLIMRFGLPDVDGLLNTP